jgi:DNA (cytosine-5)-methyltransferase 1
MATMVTLPGDSESVSLHITTQAYRRCPQSIAIERRNPPVASPFRRLAAYKYGDLNLKPKKTVELRDSSFLKIQSIILNTQTNEVRVRGHRLQRAKALNGMLSKKMNEVVLCLGIDLDDPRGTPRAIGYRNSFG